MEEIKLIPYEHKSPLTRLCVRNWVVRDTYHLKTADLQAEIESLFLQGSR